VREKELLLHKRKSEADSGQGIAELIKRLDEKHAEDYNNRLD
jgi:hypothetical protein